ncbi:MAG: HAD family hydrolase [Bryobacteraceae bacterium]|nr:HAD family hydrolase [Bryobacteraceae bacterium]
MNRAVFLDRDGVLNQTILKDGKPYPPQTASEVRIVEGAAQALSQLKKAGFLLICVTNQPDVARGQQSKANVERIHAALLQTLPLDALYCCCHDDGDECECRKPKPGMLLAAARDYSIDLAESFLVGDRWRDIDASRNAGCRSVLIDHHYQEKAPAAPPDARVASLQEAVDWILGQARSR